MLYGPAPPSKWRGKQASNVSHLVLAAMEIRQVQAPADGDQPQNYHDDHTTPNATALGISTACGAKYVVTPKMAAVT